MTTDSTNNEVPWADSMVTIQDNDGHLIDPALLVGLSEDERKEALQAAAAAKRAEERAEQKALERAIRQREKERSALRISRENSRIQPVSQKLGAFSGDSGKAVFIPKKRRGRHDVDTKTTIVDDSKSKGAEDATRISSNNSRAWKSAVDSLEMAAQRTLSHASWSQRDLEAVKQSYLGKSAEDVELERTEHRKQQRANKKITFRFKWEDADDTFDQEDPLYASAPTLTRTKRLKRRKTDMGDKATTLSSVHTKPLDKMTSRDWRIFCENYEIVVKGGRAPPPMRTFRESPMPGVIPKLHAALLDAIENVMGFRDPTPIQRQAIPIGLQRRDLIGIAETGSGKTVAFSVPICNFLLGLPLSILDRVAENGPLALVMAPTRELALQIDNEINKLLTKQRNIRSCAIVGGQVLQKQAYQLRKGVHIVVGTPGRVNECIDMAYLVLNQCSFIVLDEADRMIDMGFAPQMESILEAMGSLMKSDVEREAYDQEMEDLKSNAVPRHRVTAMFSATMPMEVERLAKEYLRHPAIISIGDQDSGKNARITQRIIFLSSPRQKDNALRELLQKSQHRSEKIIVFVNEKKHADGLGRTIERMGRTCVVLHGGKSQEQREESLATFRKGDVVMVATDVAGRGLDIPDVSHVINYDLPSRSIENYTHRIGRTGRAGKDGLATSFITDEDTSIMAPLKMYLESTGNTVPDRLARHPAVSNSAPGNLIH